jgi:hypothetical protein
MCIFLYTLYHEIEIFLVEVSWIELINENYLLMCSINIEILMFL